MKSVKEVSQLSGVSVRTLHYYDEIDLLKPSVVAENGYRYYNRDAVVRLQEILLYRELDFPLKKIKEIVGQPGYDKVQALRDQIKLLELKKSRLEAVIAHAKALQMEEEEMSFEAFDQKAVKAFQEEAQARWDQTEAYEKTEAILQSNPEITGIICGNDTMACGAVQACLDAGRNDIKIIGLDGSDEANAYIKSGDMVGTALQQIALITEMAVEQADAYLNGTAPEEEKQLVPCVAITADNTDCLNAFVYTEPEAK